MNRYDYTRLDNGRKIRTTSLAEALGIEKPNAETWLLFSPHDDDLCMGAALWIQAAVQAGVNVQVVVITDGRMGYCSLEQRDTIVEVRRSETYRSFELLGVPRSNVQYIGYPDGGLYTLQGRRKACAGETSIEGYVGLQNAMTWHLRRTRPQRVMVPSPADLHPDHQVTHNELMISLFHAAGQIWPELGKPLANVPRVYELAIYCDFPEPPNLQLITSPDIFDKKIASIAAYQSQAQIELLLEAVKKNGPVEYLRDVNFRFYSPENYRAMFA